MLKQFDSVQITRLSATPAADGLAINRRPPRVGDIAVIVEVYQKPSLGYELECTAAGQTEWLCTFPARNIGLELVSRREP